MQYGRRVRPQGTLEAASRRAAEAALLMQAGLEPVAHAAAVFHPPWPMPAALAKRKGWLSQRVSAGAAFIAVAAEKPATLR